MIDIQLIETLDELQLVMPLFLEGYREMNKRYLAFDCDEQGFVKTLIGILGTTPKNGILVAWDGIEPVGYGAAMEDTPPYCEARQLLLWAIYVKPQYSKLVTKPLFAAAEEMARQQGYASLRAYNGRFNGSSFNFFERVLGMRRLRVEFKKLI